ncbi:Protein FAR1-RELATED SEQUENCE 6 [Rhynchospora pubera]|uniref:Protein FAR1-RELATED SEQUENCE n=1 Tax=Rhynchospora pubera TaxID=906938 RepID=A0AAV8DR56_9POAL|nr:Protein FAR1-RELATED SEQUENCE 6 [Rhynchospora pubera]
MSDQSGSESSSDDETSQENNEEENPETQIMAVNNNNTLITTGDNASEPKIGMVFNSEEEAFQFYVAYGFRTGFGTVRRSNNTFDGFRYRSTFICSKGGKSRHRPNAKRPPRKKGGKTGCKAKMIVKDAHFQNRWEVIVLELEHNHPLDPGNPKLKKYLKKHPFSKKDRVPMAEGMDAVNDNLAATNLEIDYSDGTDGTRKLNFSKGDLDALMDYFDKMQDENPFFFYSLDLNELGQVRSALWVDARSRSAFRYFGDVVTFEVANFADQYDDVYLVSFIGTNHHAQTVLLGCGILSGTIISSYQWIFKTWMRCMGDKPPVAIITAYSKEIDTSVKSVFPDVKHRFCLWHVLKDLPEKIGASENIETTVFRLTNLVYDSVTIPDFEKDWLELVQQYGLQSNEWLTDLYDVRKQWVPVFIKDFFWAEMSAVDRGETVNSFFDGWIRAETTIKTFLEQYETSSKMNSEKEAYEDFRCLQMHPQIISPMPFEEQIAKVYTLEVFNKFQVEVKQLFQMSGVLVDRNGSVVSYVVTEIENGRKMGYRVAYDSVEEDIWCLCRSFQYRGILCRHALSVLRQELVMLIPNKYIIARWRKDFKRLQASMSATSAVVSTSQDPVSYDDLYQNAHDNFLETLEFGCGTHESKEHTISVLKETMDKVISFEKSLREQRMRLDADVAPAPASYTYNLINEDFTDDLSPITLSTRGWDPTMPQPKKKRKKIPGLSVSALGALKTGKKKTPSKSSGASSSGALTRTNINEMLHVQQLNEGWSLTPGGAQETYPYGVETISFDLSQYNSAPNFQWPDTRGSRLL